MQKLFSRLRVLTIAFIIAFTPDLMAQDCECSICRIPCNSPISAHRNPACPINKSRNSNASAQGTSLETQIMGAILQSVIQSLFEPSPTKTEPTAQERAQMEWAFMENQRQIAARQAELKRYNDSLSQARHDRIMQDYKKLDENQTLSIKEIDEKSKWTADINFNCKITSFSGNVFVVKTGGKMVKLTPDLAIDLLPGDWIYTDRGSRVKLHYNYEKGGKDIILGQNSFVNIITDELGANIPNLTKGSMYLAGNAASEMSAVAMDELKGLEDDLTRKRNAWAAKFKVRTPSAICGIRGTAFTVDQDSVSGTTVTVMEGMVELTGILMNEHILVEAGQKGMVTPQGEIIGPIKTNETNIDKWWDK